MVHRVGNYHIRTLRVRSRIATIHISTIRVVGYIGYEMRTALSIEAKIYTTEETKVELEYDVISQQTISRVEKILEQIAFFADHLDLQPINDKIKEVEGAIRSRMRHE